MEMVVKSARSEEETAASFTAWICLSRPLRACGAGPCSSLVASGSANVLVTSSPPRGSGSRSRAEVQDSNTLYQSIGLYTQLCTVNAEKAEIDVQNYFPGLKSLTAGKVEKTKASKLHGVARIVVHWWKNHPEQCADR